MNELLTFLAILPLDGLPPSASPSPVDLRQAPGRGAYLIGGFIGLGILLLVAALLRFPKRANRRLPDQ
jgi:hypothetical protein